MIYKCAMGQMALAKTGEDFGFIGYSICEGEDLDAEYDIDPDCEIYDEQNAMCCCSCSDFNECSNICDELVEVRG